MTVEAVNVTDARFWHPWLRTSGRATSACR